MNKKLEYQKYGDYFIPEVCLPASINKIANIGKYCLLRLDYLKNHKKGLYEELMMDGLVPEELNRVDKYANNRVDLLVKQLAKRENINEELKRNNQLEWVKEMNNIKSISKEIALNEVAYV